MTIALALGLGLIVAGYALFALYGWKPYSATIARLTCGLYVIGLASLTYWGMDVLEEGMIRTIATVLGGMLTFGGILQIFKARPLAPNDGRL